MCIMIIINQAFEPNTTAMCIWITGNKALACKLICDAERPIEEICVCLAFITESSSESEANRTTQFTVVYSQPCHVCDQSSTDLLERVTVRLLLGDNQ
jgi:hypothetical protein